MIEPFAKTSLSANNQALGASVSATVKKEEAPKEEHREEEKVVKESEPISKEVMFELTGKGQEVDMEA